MRRGLLLLAFLASAGCNALTGIDGYRVDADATFDASFDGLDARDDVFEEVGAEADVTSLDGDGDGADARDASGDTGVLSDTTDSGIDSSTPCTASAGCVDFGTYCETGGTCGSGVCKKRPSAPSMNYAAVCGCDGVSYWNASYAASLGQSVGGTACATDDCTKCPGGTTCLKVWSTVACTGAVAVRGCWAKPTDASCAGVTTDKSYGACGTATCTKRCEALLAGTSIWLNGGC